MTCDPERRPRLLYECVANTCNENRSSERVPASVSLLRVAFCSQPNDQCQLDRSVENVDFDQRDPTAMVDAVDDRGLGSVVPGPASNDGSFMWVSR
jgi:hypothetical protein